MGFHAAACCGLSGFMERGMLEESGAPRLTADCEVQKQLSALSMNIVSLHPLNVDQACTT